MIEEIEPVTTQAIGNACESNNSEIYFHIWQSCIINRQTNTGK